VVSCWLPKASDTLDSIRQREPRVALSGSFRLGKASGVIEYLRSLVGRWTPYATNLVAGVPPVTQVSPIRYPDTRQMLSRVLESRRGVSVEVDVTACRCLSVGRAGRSSVPAPGLDTGAACATNIAATAPPVTQNSRIRVVLYPGPPDALARPGVPERR
jgi:hypothetical protein